jgi:EAL domain-containing protein (putative c-di-GMP-specific phosphodiesterase class I)
VLLPGLRDAAIVAERVTDIQNVLALPMVVSGRQLSITISGGATLYPADAADVASLLKNADLAMYEAKRKGRARWCAFHPEQAAALARHSLVAHALRQALAAGALTVAFQPKLTMAGAHAGFEALARWHDGARWVPPNDFIPVAEAAGLMEKLGCVVFDLALARLRALRDGGHAPGRVAVNVTSAQLLNGDFVSMIGTMLARHDLTPADLELEMTETVLHGRAAGRVEQALHALRALGIGLALDDFGSGLASLSHLATLPIDRIKIDRSFIGAIGVGARSGVIARTVIGLARTLGLESVAEGVETQEQFAFLKDAGCDVVQGYLVAPPLLALEAAEAYLRGCRKGVLFCETDTRRS